MAVIYCIFNLNKNDTERISFGNSCTTDVLVTATGNFHVCDQKMLQQLKNGCVVCNIGHFDTEIDTQFMHDTMTWDEVKPQVHKIIRNKNTNDHVLLLSEGRLVNLGNATGHPSRQGLRIKNKMM